ncbi:hypothetical protein MKW94_005482 [Papaver nudicaule]|uniref:Acyl-[acyl-carrier-protein] hydrolase n=1 Tax=Papaver nudicaule TaxID=74823 RepID=A0AA41SLT2_PAPNU|nr:hypothetical protein [Papaver nudicaule]
MVATSTIAASAFSPANYSLTTKISGGSDNATSLGMKSNTKSSCCRGLKVKVNAQAPEKNINGSILNNYSTTTTETAKEETYVHRDLPEWNMLLKAIMGLFLATEIQWPLSKLKRQHDVLVDSFGQGTLVQGGYVFRQNFSIRSYEIGPHRTATIGTLINHLQETVANHVRGAGLLGDGFASTPEMTRRNLIWVVAKMQVVVDQYPSWGDVVQIDTWFTSASEKNGLANHWLLRDAHTGQILAKATSVWILMNKKTRKLSKIPEEVRGELEPFQVKGELGSYFTNHRIPDGRKLSKLHDNTADFVQAGLTTRLSDLDVHQHVNFSKYIGWILENAPPAILESHELYDMDLAFRRECGVGNVLKSLTAVVGGSSSIEAGGGIIECDHMLQLENNGYEVMRGRTKWRPKDVNNIANIGQITAE